MRRDKSGNRNRKKKRKWKQQNLKKARKRRHGMGQDESTREEAEDRATTKQTEQG
jgi:hypothetical protein